jgi:hypothetical protein
MKLSQVARMSALKRFLYWISERHMIYSKKQAGQAKPWTNDEVLQQYFFTNPYRENDKVTVWFRENIRDPLTLHVEVLMATVIFRWFNLPYTGEQLMKYPAKNVSQDLRKFGALVDWNEAAVASRLSGLWEHGATIFTGAYMIKAGNGPRGCKIPSVCACITNVWNERARLVQVCRDDCRLQALWQELIKFPYLGGFMAYEIVCDLRHTSLLGRATDVDTWCNIGPGARRGFNRLRGEENLYAPISKTLWADETAKLLQAVRGLGFEPRMEMREVEHSLCEWDKYERARTGEGGRMKRRYAGV